MAWAPPWLQLMSSGATPWQSLACTPTLREAWALSLAQISLRCDPACQTLLSTHT